VFGKVSLIIIQMQNSFEGYLSDETEAEHLVQVVQFQEENVTKEVPEPIFERIASYNQGFMKQHM